MKHLARALEGRKDPLRIPVYIYGAQLRVLDEICRERRKPRRLVILEAFQTYIGLYREGEI